MTSAFEKERRARLMMGGQVTDSKMTCDDVGRGLRGALREGEERE